MPIIPSLILTNQLPGITYTALVVTSASFFADGLGNQLYSASITSSNAISSSFSITSSMTNGILSGSVALPDTGSICFSGSFLYIYTGISWKSASIF